MQKTFSLIFFLFICFSTFSQVSKDTLFICSTCDTTFSRQLSEITVRATATKESQIATIRSIRNSYTISDAISTEFIKKTPDRTVGDAIKRVSGITVQNDRFVLVRGLSDRYNLAMMNKTILPSSEPDRRSFSFEVIPTNLIDNITVIKSATSSLPGDFSGGIIQITTKESTEEFLSGNFGVSYGSLTTFSKFFNVRSVPFPNSFPSTYKFRTGTVGDRRAYTKMITTPDKENRSALPNLNGAFSFGKKIEDINIVFSSNYRSSFSRSFSDRKDYLSPTELAYQYKDTSYVGVESLNSILNISYIGENKFFLKTLFSKQTENGFLSRYGENYDNLQTVKSFSSNEVQRTLLNTQLDGKIKTFDFSVGYNFLFRDQPDYRIDPFAKSFASSEDYSFVWRDSYRFWSILGENSFNLNVNKSIDKFKVGSSYTKRSRYFQARVFRYDAPDLLNEITNNTDRYTANTDLATSYLMYENKWKNIKLNAGIRAEQIFFWLNTADFSGQKLFLKGNFLDFLPSTNVSYVKEKSAVRISASKTLARPELRELTNFSYYDFVRNAQLLGNPNLKKTDIYNLDLKWEFYPRKEENIFISIFSKNFQNPIEQVVDNGSVPSNLLLTYKNPGSALVYGIEVEVKKNLNDWLSFYTNASLIKSEVKVDGIKRQLQGQSNYVVNGGINIHKKDNTLNLTYNRTGDRISAVGFQGYPDIFENSRDVIDFVYIRKIGLCEIKFSINDMLANPTIFYQKENRDLIKTRNERNVSLSLNIKF